MVIQQLRPLGTHAAPSDTAAPSLTPRILTCSPPGLQTLVSAQRQGRLRLTSGRLCWRPALRRPASMSEPRSSRPPWALLSYYSHSSGCSRGCQTSKRTFTLSLSLSHSLSPFSLYPPLLGSLLFPLPPLLLRLFDRAVRGAKWRGLFHLAFSCACVSQSKQKMRHVEGKGELSASRVSCTSCQRLQKKKWGKQRL